MFNVKDMGQRTKSILIYLPKIIIFGFALLNFLYIQSHLPNQPTAGAAPAFYEFYHWYEKSIIDVLILLAASISLLVSKRDSYLIAGILSGYIVIIGLFSLIFRKMTLLEQWRGIQEYELNIFLQWEIQFILAVIIFVFTMIYLVRDILHNNTSQNKFL